MVPKSGYLFSEKILRKESSASVNESGHIVADTAARIFADLADPQTINHAKDGSWREPLWRALTESGLTLAWVPEEHGGAGASVADGFEILQVAGRFALPVPLGETLLAGWLLARAGLEAPPGAMTVAPVRPKETIALTSDGTLSGRARGGGPVLVLVAAKDCRPGGGRTLAGDAGDEVTFAGGRPIASAPAPAGLD